MPEFTLFKDSTDLEAQKPQYKSGEAARNVVKWLFSDLAFSSKMITWEIFKALFIKRNPKVFGEMRAAVSEILTNLGTDTKNHTRQCANVSEQVDLKEILIGNALCIYAFTEPNHNEKVTVPVKINNEWKGVEYQVKKIPLTPGAPTSPYYAYGLVPTDKTIGADSKILFMGTYPVPTARGARDTMTTDLFPGQGAGESVYRLGKKAIQSFVDEQHKETGKKVTSIGVSLGGSLSLYTHINQPDKVNARAYCPPALLAHSARAYKNNLKGKEAPKDGVKVFVQPNDFVFEVGTWIPENADVYQIVPNKNTTTNKLYNHMKAYSGMDPEAIIKLDPKQLNNTFRRWSYTILWQTLSIPYFLWNMIYMGLKLLVYPLNRLMAHITNDPYYDVDDSNPKEQKTWQKVVGGAYNVLAALIALPFVLVDLAVTTSVAVLSMVLFSIMHGVSTIVEKLQSLSNAKSDNNNENSSKNTPKGP